MHLNYHFLKFLCPALKQSLLGKKIHECFSQNKDELVIGCSDSQNQIYIRANLLPVISALSFPEDFKRSKRNTISLFPNIIDQEITDVEVFKNERAFSVSLQNGIRLVFKLHGTRSNVLIYEEGKSLPILLFRNELKDDKNIHFEDLNVELDLSHEKFVELEGNASKFIPTLGKIPRNWLKSQGYIEADLSKKWGLLQDLLDLMDSPLYSIIKETNEYHLSLLPEQVAIYQSADPIAACNELFRYKVIIQSFEKEKKQWQRTFEDQRKKALAYIKKTGSKLHEIEHETSPSQVADIIMANLHQITPGTEEISLFNFYANKDETFRLKKNISPQKFAETLYRKSKNRKKELQHLQENLELKEKQLAQTEKWLAEVDSFSQFRELKHFLKENHLIKQQKDKEEQVPFKRFEIDGFEILVGKSAKANDELLRYFAWKDDLWLHAKDVSGSHVLIKYRSGINFPKTVIERAAEFAAYYSKNKNETLAAVMYTPSKYVRKVKGSAPGAVMVDKESVIMVPPRGPQEED
ncbi:NFACT RNA binding domain-containing protein [Mongoliibacter ruber]|uniref:Putative ribosome quality control (RQC) complex YloA/Tae2 family protein n=1 Tax=Mongoliibacter ruber TaxID=1750599 RepID=A0A2T0WL68_9BACT|nr:NFACT RNA binding domain-containing protein [Mongoliibacter ruber]PRY87425.1 putative ribosome quality control (RQC) complex YloA/Tae2 family protein [Mongoliibacter ruber]